jgi:chromosome segregation ATPase
MLWLDFAEVCVVAVSREALALKAPQRVILGRIRRWEMRRATFLVFGFLFIATGTLGQTSSPSSSGDSQTLQALLKEVRELRQDLRTSLVSTQRAQLLFYRMQAQQAAVGRAQKRHDDARAELDKAQEKRNKLEQQFKFYSSLDTEESTPDPSERKRLEDSLPEMKVSFEAAQGEEQQAQSKEMEAKDQLQIEQGKLDGLQEELDRIDKSLENLAKRPGN